MAGEGVAAAEAQLHAASAQIGVATAELYPSITLSGSVGAAALNPGHLFNPARLLWSIAAGLTEPISGFQPTGQSWPAPPVCAEGTADPPQSLYIGRPGEETVMASRSFWKGYLKLSLVTCPVVMMSATSESEKVRFHTLNRPTRNRVVSRYVDAVSGEPVDEDDEVKGYESGDGEYLMLEDDELDSIALESTRTIDIEKFVPRESIEWIWYDTPHYLIPNDPVGEEAFAVIREAMAVTGTVGISRLVLYRRERAVMLEPRDLGIVLWTLRYGDEVRDSRPYFAGIKAEKPEPQVLDLVSALIDKKTVPWDPAMLEDPVQAQLLKLISAKKKGQRPAKPKAPAERPTNVVNIMDALRKSIAADEERPKGR